MGGTQNDPTYGGRPKPPEGKPPVPLVVGKKKGRRGLSWRTFIIIAVSIVLSSWVLAAIGVHQPGFGGF